VKVAICEEIESKLSRTKSGRYPKGALKKIIDLHLGVHGAWLTRTMILGYLRRRRAKQKEAREAAAAAALLENTKKSKVQHAGADAGGADADAAAGAVPAIGIGIGIGIGIVAAGSTPPHPGAPPTASEDRHRKRQFERMKNAIVRGWVGAHRKPAKTLAAWIAANQSRYGFAPHQLTTPGDQRSYALTKAFLYSRVARNSLVSKGVGQRPVLASIEPGVLAVLRSRMLSRRQTPDRLRADVLGYVNQRVRGTQLETDYRAWKTVHHRQWRADYDPSAPVEPPGTAVGVGWYQNFCKRWATEIQAAEAAVRDNHRYDRDTRVYTEGLAAMHRWVGRAPATSDGDCDGDTTPTPTRIKEPQAGTAPMGTANTHNNNNNNNDDDYDYDYLALIRFKQLRVAEEPRTAPPNDTNTDTNTAALRTLWETTYQHAMDPEPPTKPPYYKACHRERGTAATVSVSGGGVSASTSATATATATACRTPLASNSDRVGSRTV